MAAGRYRSPAEELFYTDDVSFSTSETLVDSEFISPFDEMLSLQETEPSLFDKRESFTGTIGSDPCISMNVKNDIDNRVLQFEEINTISSFEEAKRIRPLSELLQGHSKSNNPILILEPHQVVDQYGFIVNSKVASKPVTQSRADQQKWQQLISQWDTLSEEKKKKVKIIFLKNKFQFFIISFIEQTKITKNNTKSFKRRSLESFCRNRRN